MRSGASDPPDKKTQLGYDQLIVSDSCCGFPSDDTALNGSGILMAWPDSINENAANASDMPQITEKRFFS